MIAWSQLLRASAIAILTVCVLSATGGWATACPMCKEALASGSDGGDIISGYFWSILFMMCMPFALIGSFGLYAYLQVRKARNATAQESVNPTD